MRIIKWILLVIGIIFIAIQFKQPERNKSAKAQAADISSVLTVPDSVKHILHVACYDCHSNNTNYPWYSYVQPVGWFLAKDISEAKDILNFSEFGGYPARRQQNKLDAIADEIRNNGMPLPSYKFMHKNARLGKNEKALLTNWAEHSGESLPVSN